MRSLAKESPNPSGNYGETTWAPALRAHQDRPPASVHVSRQIRPTRDFSPAVPSNDRGPGPARADLSDFANPLGRPVGRYPGRPIGAGWPPLARELAPAVACPGRWDHSGGGRFADHAAPPHPRRRPHRRDRRDAAPLRHGAARLRGPGSRVRRRCRRGAAPRLPGHGERSDRDHGARRPIAVRQPGMANHLRISGFGGANRLDRRHHHAGIRRRLSRPPAARAGRRTRPRI